MYFKIFLVFLIFPQIIIAQETPYYQLLTQRKLNHEIINLPNLNSFSISYFFAVSGGFKKSYPGSTAISPTEIVANSPINGLWEITFGQNRNENWHYEIGVSEMYNNLTTRFTKIGNGSLSFINEEKQYFIPLRVKKKIVTLDRVSRNAFINVGIGAYYLVNKPKIGSENGTLEFTKKRNPSPEDFNTLDYEIYKSKFPVTFEFLTELRGKVTERFELSLYFKGIVKSSQNQKNNFQLNYINGNYDSFGNFSKSVSLVFGLQAKLNSPKYFRYKSKVE
ncbi:hypothetical protein EGI22_19680 [Lacihabitans sp. LS3-19]|uniref:hypothetical protein n=1 Tax=Lacihabitans sp. LS3-19 TaxID=2487335 RepID=UPI0020CE6E82|nr:hypothetical protein [Lacihabitans sp. LS3-19]MCP9770131.1 hypothetical protein [Lacihabitans sp. LS3-19]